MTTSETPILPAIPPSSLPDSQAGTPKAVHKRAKEVAALLKRFIAQNPAVAVEIDNKHFPCIEAWQFVAACYAHTPMIAKTESILGENDVESGYIASAHLANGQGRIVSAAESACMRAESDWLEKPAFQLRSMAQTRACGKVCRNLFAYVMVMAGLCPTPAEEMPGSHQTGSRSPMSGKKCSKCGNQVSDKKHAQTSKKHGKALCLVCERQENSEKGAEILRPINDPRFVQQSVEEVQKRKATQPQPIAKALDESKELFPYAL